MTIQHLKDELGSSQKVIDEVYRKYDGLRVSRDQKDQSIRRLQQELHTCHDMLEQAQKEKLVLADKMRAIENEKTDMEFDYQWLCDKIKQFEDGDCVDFSKTSSRTVTTTKTIRTTYDGETTEFESYGGMENVDTKFQDIQSGYRKTMSNTDEQVLKE